MKFSSTQATVVSILLAMGKEKLNCTVEQLQVGTPKDSEKEPRVPYDDTGR